MLETSRLTEVGVLAFKKSPDFEKPTAEDTANLRITPTSDGRGHRRDRP